MDDDLIAAHRDVPALMPFLHLPVQSGSDRMLAAMNRRHTAADYLRLVDRLRAARPDLALSSDFIVGHPGETDADYEATHGADPPRRLRPGVQLQVLAAPRHPRRRRARAGGRGRQGRAPASAAGPAARPAGRFNAGCAGLTVPVLFTGPGRHPGQIAGRSPWLQPVHLDGASALVGREMPVTIVAGTPQLLVRNPNRGASLRLTHHRRVSG